MSESLPIAIAAAAFVVAVIAAGIAVGAVRLRHRPAPSAGPAPHRPDGHSSPFNTVDPFHTAETDILRGDPRALKPGDIAEIRGRSYAVRGSLRFIEGDWGWAEHLLDTGAGHRTWLSVEEDPDLELVLWTEVPTATVEPGEPTLDFDGRRYTRDDSGHARFTGIGTTGVNPAGTMRYHDYTAPDGALLCFERYGGNERWEVGRGERLHRAELHIYPQAG
ncbi:MAG TPA: DUF4178 domain-containing protein [Pilimelia sp.]|nr:DUF4178 domain-containing protein [Pilimelia sp.]